MGLLNYIPNFLIGYALGTLLVTEPVIAIIGLIGSFFMKTTLDFSSKNDTIDTPKEN